MRKGGYYVNNTLLGEVDKWTGRRVNKLIAKKDRVTSVVDKETSGRVNELIVKKDRVTRGRVDKETSWRVNELIVKEDKVTGEQVDKLDEWTSERVDCEGRQSNSGTGVSTYNIWGEKALKKARD